MRFPWEAICSVAEKLGPTAETVRRWVRRAEIDFYDSALAETVIGLYKTELIRGPTGGPWRNVDDVELATLGWGALAHHAAPPQPPRRHPTGRVRGGLRCPTSRLCTGWKPITRASTKLQCDSVRKWVRRADVDDGAVAGATTADRARIRVLEQENRELRRANAILKSASVDSNRRLSKKR